VLHLFGDQDFSNLRSCIHVLIFPENSCRCPCQCLFFAVGQTWSGLRFPNI
jgi:hypothetical protein